jgi:hypothetical protein
MRVLLFSLLSFVLFTAQKCENANQLSEESFISIRKTPCFGTCPTYEFTINGLGEATFKGEMNVKKKGNYTRTFTEKQTMALFNAYKESDFYSFEDEYLQPDLMDLPYTYLTLNHMGKKKTITLYYQYPDALNNLAKLTESFALSEGWTAKDNM